MRVTSPKSEIGAVVNLCNGLPEVQTYLMGALKAEYFGVPAVKEIFNRVEFLVQQHGKQIPTIGILAEDISLSDESRELFNDYKKAEKLKDIDRAKALLDVLEWYRKARICLNCSEKTLEILRKDKVNPSDVLNIYEQAVTDSQSSLGVEEDLMHIGENCTADSLVAEILAGKTTSFIPTGFKNFDDINGGFRRKGLIALAATTSGGKAQPLYSKIKTPNGWTTMGEIKIGDIVSAPDGTSTKITHLFPQGLKDVYKITFEDGRSTECCKEHLWRVYNFDWSPREKTLSLEQIIEWRNKYKNSLSIPLPKAVYGETQKLPIDPYILGCLLGDGSIVKRVIFINADSDIIQRFRSRLVQGYQLKFAERYGYTVIKTDKSYKGSLLRKGKIFNYYIKEINKLGLRGTHSWDKFIPEIYKEASVEQRLDLVRGLLDTDGTVADLGAVSFSTTSYQLALDFQYLIRSLGGWSKLRSGKENPSYIYRYKGKVERRPCRRSYTCSVSFPQPQLLFTLDRKKKRLSKKKNRKLRIKSIKYVGKEVCQCIMVDHPNHLYITDDFIVTHNSALSIQLLINQYRAGYDVALVSLEMDHEEILCRILSNIAKVDSLHIMRNLTSDIEKKRMAEEWKKFVELGVKNKNKYSIYTPMEEGANIKQICYRLARHDYSVLIVDYVSLLDHGDQEAWKALGETARFLKRYIARPNMVGVLLCQLSEENKIRYARAIKEHADNVWSWIYNSDIAEETGHIITVDQQKARNQQVFRFRLDEKFNYMTLTDCKDQILGQDPLINDFTRGAVEGLGIEDDLEEF